MTLSEIIANANANSEFIPGMSSNEMFFGTSTNDRLTDVIADVAEACLGKADSSHTHSGYAASTHTHTPASIGAATADHSHTDYAASGHTHTPASIGAAAAEHSHDYAAPTHSHTQTDIAGLSDALAAKANTADLGAKADLVDGKVPTSQLPAFVDDVLEYTELANFPTTGESGKIYVAQDTNKTYRWSGTAYVEISASIALGETAATAYRGDRGKTAYDHSQNSTVHVTAAQKEAWDGKAAGDHTHTPEAIGAAAASHTHDYAASDHGHSYNDLSDKPTIPTIPASLPANGGNADTVDGKHASDFAASDHSHTPASIGAAAASHTHSGYAASNHTHSGYASSGHTHTASDVGAAAAAHTHTAAAVGAAPASHTHSEYAASNHGHSDYASSNHSHTAADVGALPSTGGTISGALTVTGAATIKGKAYTQQMLPFDGGSYSIGSADNRYYSTYLRVNPNVSSDRRCKRDIEAMDIDALAAFVAKLPVVSYNYNDDAADEAKRIGLIAQDVVAADPEIAKGCIEQDEKGFFSLRAADLVFPLIAAVQALTKRVEELEGK